MLRTLQSLCNPDPRTMVAQYSPIEVGLANCFGRADDGYYYAFRSVLRSGGKNSETLNGLFKWADYFVDESKRTMPLGIH